MSSNYIGNAIWNSRKEKYQYCVYLHPSLYSNMLSSAFLHLTSNYADPNFNYNLWQNAYINGAYEISLDIYTSHHILLPSDSVIVIPDFCDIIKTIPPAIGCFYFVAQIDKDNRNTYTRNPYRIDNIKVYDEKYLWIEFGDKLKYYLYYNTNTGIMHGYINDTLIWSNKDPFILHGRPSYRTSDGYSTEIIFANELCLKDISENYDNRMLSIIPYSYLFNTNGDLKIHNIYKTTNLIVYIQFLTYYDFDIYCIDMITNYNNTNRIVNNNNNIHLLFKGFKFE